MAITNIILLLVNIALGVSGQTLIKYGVNRIGNFSNMPFFVFILKSFTSIPIISGIALYVLSTVTWLMLLSRVNLGIAYPALSLGYIAILIVSWIFLKETIATYQILGVILIISGIFIIFSTK